jgi:hypothetical protein
MYSGRGKRCFGRAGDNSHSLMFVQRRGEEIKAITRPQKQTEGRILLYQVLVLSTARRVCDAVRLLNDAHSTAEVLV